MSNGRMRDEVRSAVGLFTTLERPWQDRDNTEPVEGQQETTVRPSGVTAVLAGLTLWLSAFRSLLPDGWL